MDAALSAPVLPTTASTAIDGRSSQDKPFLLKFRGNEIKKSWETSRDVEVIALLAWAEIRMPITAVDEAAHIATLAGNPRPSNKEIDARYWIETRPMRSIWPANGISTRKPAQYPTGPWPAKT